MKLRLLLLLSLLALLAITQLTAPAPTHACMCFSPDSLKQALDKSEVAFSGKVVSINDQTEDLSKRLGMRLGRLVVFEVSSVWKGQVPHQVEVAAGWADGDCGYEFTIGREYIVFGGNTWRPSYISTGLCSGNIPVSRSESGELVSDFATRKDIAALGIGNDPVGAKPVSFSGQLLFILGVALLLACALAFFSYKQRRKSEHATQG
jgi:hypothetical protein